jgi:S-formylglutathione hydrolase FrmB
MGGYGTWTIGMTHPEAFNALYAQSACCISPRIETVESAAKLAAIPIEQGVKADFGTRAALSSMVAWSPNPQNPPYFADFPIKDGELDTVVLAKWANNAPLAMVASHVGELKSFEAIGSDVGTKDGLIADDTLIHEELDRFGIANQWATYDGTHVDKIAQRFDEVVLPFFARHLDMGSKQPRQ